jgi:hypothetical protein
MVYQRKLLERKYIPKPTTSNKSKTLNTFMAFKFSRQIFIIWYNGITV